MLVLNVCKIVYFVKVGKIVLSVLQDFFLMVINVQDVILLARPAKEMGFAINVLLGKFIYISTI